MKTTALIFTLLLICIGSIAQFDNTYDVNFTPSSLAPGRIIETSDGGTVFVNSSYGSNIGYFVATKLDPGGSVIWSRTIMPFAPLTENIYNVTALVETDDNGILIAGFINYNQNMPRPIAVKLNSSGVFLWCQMYDVNTAPVAALNQNKISIIRVQDDPNESYFIVSNSYAEINNSNNSTAVNVIKIDANGGMIWSKKYYDWNWASSYPIVRDIPGDIAFSPADNLYMITGRREQWTVSATHEMFFFGIDMDGNLLTPFKTITTPGYPAEQDMVYNPTNNRFGISLLHGNTGYSGDPCVVSGIGLVEIDAGLTIWLANFYWPFTDGVENYGHSISLGSGGAEYVIACFNYKSGDCGSTGTRVPAFLKIDAPSGNPMWFMRYHLNDSCVLGRGSSTTCIATGAEEYILVAENNNQATVIRTDINGKTPNGCFEPDHVQVLPYDYQETWYEYFTKENGVYYHYLPRDFKVSPPHYKCVEENFYWAEETNSGTGHIAISGQHQLSSNASEIIITNESTTTSTVEIYNIAGTLVMQGQLAAAAPTVPLKNVELSTGMYIVRFKDLNGKLISTDKIIVAD